MLIGLINNHSSAQPYVKNYVSEYPVLARSDTLNLFVGFYTI